MAGSENKDFARCYKSDILGDMATDLGNEHELANLDGFHNCHHSNQLYHYKRIVNVENADSSGHMMANVSTWYLRMAEKALSFPSFSCRLCSLPEFCSFFSFRD